MKSLFCLSLLLISSIQISAQNLSDRFFQRMQQADFNDKAKAVVVWKAILKESKPLSENETSIVFNNVAKLYEDLGEADSAIHYYGKLIKLAPDYYVAHLAIGYLYVKKANAAAELSNATKGNRIEYDRNYNTYRNLVKTALPHLEKAYACDSENNTQVMNLLVNYSKVLKLPSTNEAILERTKSLAGHCITLLKED